MSAEKQSIGFSSLFYFQIVLAIKIRGRSNGILLRSDVRIRQVYNVKIYIFFIFVELG